MSSYSTPDPENFISDGEDLIEGYSPYIGDYSSVSTSEPFSVIRYDFRTEEEIDRARHSLRHTITSKIFDPPVSLSDFCLIAREKWDEDLNDDSEFSVRLCSIY